MRHFSLLFTLCIDLHVGLDVVTIHLCFNGSDGWQLAAQVRLHNWHLDLIDFPEMARVFDVQLRLRLRIY